MCVPTNYSPGTVQTQQTNNMYMW